jgi:DNA-binding LacI/PurR family transcriptional regulator
LRLARERLMGYQAALRAAGLPSEGIGLGEGNWECESGYRAMQTILQSRPLPTALFAANDRMAIGAICAAREAALRVPEDISFIGLDDIEVAAYQNPPLTTIRQSFAELATLGVRLLLDLVNERAPVVSQVVISPQLIVRHSTARVSA